MMFYDDQFSRIIAFSPFSEEGSITLDDGELVIRGFFCSGNYGVKEYDKGYSTRKTEKRQSFKVAFSSVPESVNLMRREILVHGRAWVIDNVTGNQSGILELALKPGKTEATNG